MANESIHMPTTDQNLDYQMMAHLMDGLRKESKFSSSLNTSKPNMHTELRTLTFWRAIISECLASFLYVFIVCGAAAGAGIGASVSSVLLSTSLASGLSMAVLTHCFIHISGAHINPAVTIAHFFTRLISPLRAAMYVAAQCGGGIAGAALLYGVTVPGYQGNLQAAITHTQMIAAWERFGVEMVLTFVVVFTYFVSTNTYRKIFGNSSAMIGAAYSACSFVSMPYLNPARSLGPSFVLNKWDNHWVYWIGPLVGGAVSGLLYEIIFNSKRKQMSAKDSEESSSINSEEDINYDIDIEKPNPMQPKFHGSTYNTYRAGSAGNGPTSKPQLQQQQQQLQQQGYCQTMYQTKVDRVESIYGGTRSLYCKSPPLTRANLNRSQSVYTKSNAAINRSESGVIRAGPLVPAQSMYPLRVAPGNQQNTHLQNQNVQNQMQQRSESIYGIRGSMRQSNTERSMPERMAEREQSAFQPIYGSRSVATPNDTVTYDREVKEMREDPVKYNRSRPDSVYGMSSRRMQSAQSDDSSYGSYHGASLTPPTRGASTNGSGNYQQNPSTMIQQQQTYGMLPPPSPHHPQQQPQKHLLQHPQQHPHHQQPPQQQSVQNERKLSSSTTTSQRNVEFSQNSTNKPPPHQNPLPPPPHQNQPPPHPNYQMHPIRQN
ncbi:unnamed protein product [Diamesa serratosioi]